MTIELSTVAISGIKSRLLWDMQEKVSACNEMAETIKYNGNIYGLSQTAHRAQARIEGAERILREMGISVEWPDNLNEIPNLIYKGEAI